MLDILNKDDYRADSVHKNLIIELDDGTIIDNVNIKSESMKLREILMDGEQLKFGRCNSSQFGITLGNVDASLKDKVIKPYLVVGGNEVNKSAEGNPITVTDSANQPLIYLKEEGYTIQDGTPTPDAPIAIQGLGDDGNIEVITTGKNIFGGIALANALVNSGSTNVVVDEENGTVQFGHNTNYKDTVNRVLFDKFKENTQYTFIFKGVVNKLGGNSTWCNTNLFIIYTDGETKKFNFEGASGDSIDTVFTTPMNKTIASINYGYAHTDIVTYNYNECGVFEGVITEAEFEPYQSSSAIIPIDTPLYEGDYIEYFADGTGQIVRKYEKVVFNGSESWTLGGSNTVLFTYVTKEPKARYIKEVYCSHYQTSTKYWTLTSFGGCGFILDNIKQFGIKENKYTTVDDFKTWLQSNPITVVYELAGPIVTALTAEQVAEIEKLYTFEPVTNVFAESNTSIKYRYNKALPLGVFTVKEVPRLSQVSHKQITALDNMHKIDRDVTEWYSNLTFPMTQKAFRDSFFAYIGLEQVETELLFDSLAIDNPFGNMVSVSGRVIIEGICELNARFGHCDREGKFDYIKLNANPSDDEILDLEKTYINCAYDDFVTQTIDRVIIVDEYGTQVATSDNNVGSNTYVINNNYLLYGKTVDELRSLGNQFIELVKDISYTPLAIESKGLPYVELGDSIRVAIKDRDINSFVFNRTLTGIQALRDTYSAEGEEYLLNDLNSIQAQIDNVNRKTERTKVELTTSVEGLKSTVTSVEKVANNASSKADNVASDLKNNYSTTTEMQSQISQSANEIKTTVSAVEKKADNNATDLNALETRVNSAETSITQNANSITSLATRMDGAESSITQNANKIALKVSKGDVSSQISAETGQVSIKSNRLVVDSTNFSLTANGTLTAKNGNFTGTITSSNATITGGSVNVVGTGNTDTKITVRDSNSTLVSSIAPAMLDIKNGTNYATQLSAGLQTGSVGTSSLVSTAGTSLMGLGATGLNFGSTSSSSLLSYYRSNAAYVGGNLTVAGKTFLRSSMVVGSSKTGWNDQRAGCYIGSDGTMHLSHAGAPYIGFHYANAVGNTAYIQETSSGTITIANGLKINTNSVIIKLVLGGYTVTTGAGTSKQIFTDATLKSYYSGYDPDKTIVLLANGWGDKCGTHFHSAAYLVSSKAWYATFEASIASSTQMQITYLVICWA